MSVSTARYNLLKSRVDRFNRVIPGVGEGNIRAVHQARVASRRLRELLPILRLEGDGTRKLVRRLRKVTRRLGRVREADVLLPLIDELHEARRPTRPTLVRVTGEVKARRKAAQKHLSKSDIVELKRIGRKLETAAAKLEDDDSPRAAREWQWALEARIARRAAALRAAIDKAGAVYLPDRLHSMRVALKKLRYSIELSEEAANVKEGADLRMLKRAQELLGRLHDLEVLIDRVRHVQASLAPPDVNAWRELNDFVLSIEDRCRRLHARYLRGRGALIELCDRLGARSTAAPRGTARRAG
jgi:CHAD domain-containing protein